MGFQPTCRCARMPKGWKPPATIQARICEITAQLRQQVAETINYKYALVSIRSSLRFLCASAPLCRFAAADFATASL